MHEGGKLTWVGKLSLAERLQGRQGNPFARATSAVSARVTLAPGLPSLLVNRALECHTCTASVEYLFFFSTNCLPKILFSNSFPKNRSDWESIQSECGFYGFMINFWICPKQRINPFLDLDFPEKTHPYFHQQPGFVARLLIHLDIPTGYRWISRSIDSPVGQYSSGLLPLLFEAIKRSPNVILA